MFQHTELKMTYLTDAEQGLENFLAHLTDIHSFGRYLETVSIYPVFLSVHCILVALALRNHDNGIYVICISIHLIIFFQYVFIRSEICSSVLMQNDFGI